MISVYDLFELGVRRIQQSSTIRGHTPISKNLSITAINKNDPSIAKRSKDMVRAKTIDQKRLTNQRLAYKQYVPVKTKVNFGLKPRGLSVSFPKRFR